MSNIDAYLRQELKKRRDVNALRALSSQNEGLDFCSNDYLGLAREKLRIKSPQQYAATGSRLISGNHTAYIELEHFLQEFHHAEAALVFTSGYSANLGLISSIAGRHDTILYDQLIHASIRDALQLSKCRALSFRHNDLSHLREKMSKASGKLWVIVESVYSMDGDEAPLKELQACCEDFSAALIVDEAHAVGVLGPGGRGVVVEQGLSEKVWARVITFGKAIGSHGAAVLGSALLRDYLINFSRPFIYTTGLPPDTVYRILAAYQFMKTSDRQQILHELIRRFQNGLNTSVKDRLIPSRSAIQSLVVPGNDEVKTLAASLQIAGFDIRPILHPTVPKNSERLRICLHSFNRQEEIEELVSVINQQVEDPKE